MITPTPMPVELPQLVTQPLTWLSLKKNIAIKVIIDLLISLLLMPKLILGKKTVLYWEIILLTFIMLDTQIIVLLAEEQKEMQQNILIIFLECQINKMVYHTFLKW